MKPIMKVAIAARMEWPLPAETREVSSATGCPSSRSRAATTANEPIESAA